MGKNFRSYTFIPETTNSYNADNGDPYSVASKIGYNRIIDADVSQRIVVAAGGNFQTDNTPPNICDNEAGNSWFTPRFLQFEYQTGADPDITSHKLKVVIPDIDAILTVGAEIRSILTTAGGRIRCIKLLGERFTNIVYEVLTPPLPDFLQTVRFTSPGLFAGIFEYESDVGDDGDTYLSFSMASDVAGAAPSVIDTDEGFEAEPKSRCALRHQKVKSPRRVIITTQHTEGLQKTIVPIASDSPDDIMTSQIFFSGLPQAVCVRYEGETNFKVAKYLP